METSPKRVLFGNYGATKAPLGVAGWQRWGNDRSTWTLAQIQAGVQPLQTGPGSPGEPALGNDGPLVSRAARRGRRRPCKLPGRPWETTRTGTSVREARR